ncbi:MAG: Nif3-like dinuclear metal center hexameric protein [Tepidisphaeraceae bacterium]
MQLSTIITILEEIASPSLAESWDNVGLLTGDPNQDISGILLTIDYSAAVAEEARASKCDLVIAYHPPIFHPLKRLLAGSVVFDAIRRGVAIYSPHTALDVAEGGTNDMLADALGLTDRQPLRPGELKATQYKLVVFVPVEAVQRVSRALFDAGAGNIGNYASCSFRSPGTGTFFGREGARPAVGEAGRLEQVEEIRLETIVPIAGVNAVLAALRQSHPYEEPAFDLNVLAPAVGGSIKLKGQGRIGSMPPKARADLFDRIKRELGIDHLLIAGPTEGSVSRAAVCAGACGDLLDDAMKASAELYLTGEIRHHDAVKAAAGGMTVVCTLHSNSERAVLKRVKKRMEETAGMPPIRLAAVDRDPFSVR